MLLLLRSPITLLGRGRTVPDLATPTCLVGLMLLVGPIPASVSWRKMASLLLLMPVNCRTMVVVPVS